MATPVLQTEGSLTFGPFRLVASERLLTRDAIPVKVSARAFDILAALTSRPNEVVSKRDLVARVWRSEEHTSELQSLMRISYAVFCLKKKHTRQRKDVYHIRYYESTSQ